MKQGSPGQDQCVCGCQAIAHPLQKGPEDDKHYAADDLQCACRQGAMQLMLLHAYSPHMCELLMLRTRTNKSTQTR